MRKISKDKHIVFDGKLTQVDYKMNKDSFFPFFFFNSAKKDLGESNYIIGCKTSHRTREQFQEVSKLR